MLNFRRIIRSSKYKFLNFWTPARWSGTSYFDGYEYYRLNVETVYLPGNVYDISTTKFRARFEALILKHIN